MKKKHTGIALLAFTAMHLQVMAGDIPGKQSLNSKAKSGFIENKGQIIDQDNKPNSSVLYLLNTSGMNVQLRRSGFSYDLYRITNKEQRTANYEVNSPPRLQERGQGGEVLSRHGDEVQFHRIDFDLINSDNQCQIIAGTQSSGYINYYTTGTPEEGVTGVRSYNNVTYQNIYPRIDLEFLADTRSSVKYNFVVHPGGDVATIRMKITDPKIEVSATGSLLLTTSQGLIEEGIPESHFLISDTNVAVKVRFYTVSPGVYGIRSDQPVPTNATLIIDPVPDRLWGTYYGGSNQESIYGSVTDNSGNCYVAGSTSSLSNIATAGAHQVIFGGGLDGFFAKFTSGGSRLWATYYGGTGSDHLYGITYTVDGFLALAGRTFSFNNISTPGSFQPAKYNTMWEDAFLVKFDNAGIRQWGTYYGDAGTDHGYGCASDASGNIYLLGMTDSPNNIASAGSHQTVIGGGRDIILVKFTPAGDRIWGTYYGGILDDWPGYYSACSVDGNDNVYIGGFTSSPTAIATTGSFQPVNSGGFDGLLVKFDPDGVRQWGTYLGGPLAEHINVVKVTPQGNILIGGVTGSSSGVASPGAFQTTYGGGNTDGFLGMFYPDGQRNWVSYYGDTGEDEINCGESDASENIYFSGFTGSISSISTASTFQPVYGGGLRDAMLLKFTPSGERIWGTYYGGEDDDWSYALSLQNNNMIYLGGETKSQTNISTTGAQQTVHGGGFYDAFLVKFMACNSPGTTAQIIGPLEVCQESTGVVYFIPDIPDATSYQWVVPGGVTIVAGQGTTSIAVNFGPGVISGQITVTGINSCGAGAPFSITISTLPRPTPVISGNNNVCEGEDVFYSTEPGKTAYTWTFSAGGTNSGGGLSTDNFINITWNTPGIRWVQVNYIDINGCTALNATQRDIQVTMGIPVEVTIATSTNPVCAGTSVTFTATPTNPGTNPFYQWKVNGIDQGINSPIFSYVPLNNDVVICILTSSNATCISNNPATSNQLIMVVDPNMAVGVSIGAIPNPYCTGDQVTITATPDHGGLTPNYLWKVNDIAMTAIGPVYTYTPVNGDQVRCYMTSSLQCTTNNPATSNNIVLIENSNFPAGVNITASANPFCPGTSVTYTAWPTNGGTLPSFQWKVNGINTGSNLPTYTYSPQPGDSIHCIMTSNLSCVTGSPASSAKVIMSALPVPAVTFTTCFDTITTLSAKPIKLHGGLPPGGPYTGPGVNTAIGVFTPSVAGIGTKTITYSYTNVASCSASKTKTITVQDNPAFTCGNNLIDIRDNKVYPTVQLGTQCWMQANLDFGTSINDLTHQTDNCIVEKYTPNSSLLTPNSFYQWDEVMRYDPTPGLQGLCPPGWHVPYETEWNTLFNFYQGNARAGYPMQDQFLNGFKAQQNGVYYLNSLWSFNDFATLFWSSTMADQTRAYAHGMNTIDQSVSVYAGLKANGFSVRCLLD